MARRRSGKRNPFSMMSNEATQRNYDICPHCKAGKAVEFRSDTGEWVHTYVIGHGMSHTLCVATDLRNKDQEVLNG